MNYCFINPEGSKLEVVLSVENGLLSGALFRHMEFPNGSVVIRDEYKIKTGVQGKASFEMKDSPDQMEEEVLSWLIQTCSPLVGVDKGDMKIEFFQDGIRCETKNPVFYRLQNVPVCDSDDDPVKRDGIISFRNINVVDIENLITWESDIDLL